MYYLNDKHSQYEYGIYIRHGTGIPYIVERPHRNYWDLVRELEEEAKKHHRYNRIYFIDEKWFKNEYERNVVGTYYKILRRPIADWEEIIEEERRVA